MLYPFAKLVSFYFLNEADGAWTTNYTALQPYEELKPAGYYQKNSLSSYSPLVTKFDQGKELWNFSEDKLKLKSLI